MPAKKVLVAAVCASLFLSLILAIPSSAEGQDPIIIVSGKNTAYNVNIAGAPPLKKYTSSPPLMVAAEVGSGAVVAAGTASTCRDNRWNNPDNPIPYFDVLLDKAFQWMKPGANKVLWFEGYSVYNTIYTQPVQCQQLKDALEARGYTLTGDATTPITSSLLSGYDIMVICQLQLPSTETGTGGNPDLLPDADVQAIKSFVEGGNGLLIMDASDYGGRNYYKVQNKILEALDVGFYFQDDQVQEDTNKWGGANYQPIADVDITTEIGSAYQSATGKNEIGLYSACSIRIETDYDVSVAVSPTVNVAEAGKPMTYKATITNIGTKPDNYTITVGDENGWSLSLSKNNVSLENGENAEIDVNVTVPSGLTKKTVNWITVNASGVLGGEKENQSVRAINIFPIPSPPYPIVPGLPHFLGPGLPTLTVDLPAVPIVTGIGSGYSNDITPRAPWPILWGQGEFPPVVAAAFVDNGRVVAMPNSILRDSYFDRAELSDDEMMSNIVRWIIDWRDPKGDNLHPEEYKFLYLVSGPGVYHTPFIVSKWLALLEGLGFNVSTAVDVSVDQPVQITPGLLENCDILHLNEILRPLSPDEIQAVVNWVRAGGRLIIGCQADYGGYGMPMYPNAVLEALNCPIRFQDDELYDDNSWVVDGPWYPQVYFENVLSVNSKFDVWFPAIDFTASMAVRSLTANDVRVLFPFTITNKGTRGSSYKVEVQETSSTLLGWDVEWWPTEVSVAAGENIEGYITIAVPKIVERKRMDLRFTVTDQTLTSLTKSFTFAALGDNKVVITPAKFENGQSVSTVRFGNVTIMNLGYSGGGAWTYVVNTTGGETKVVPEADIILSGGQGFPLWIIAAAIVVIVVVVVAVYFVMIKKK